MAGIQQGLDLGTFTVDQKRDQVRRQKLFGFASAIGLCIDHALTKLSELLLGPVEEWACGIEWRTRIQAIVVELACRGRYLVGNRWVEAEDEGRVAADRSRGPNLGRGRHFEDASKPKTFVSHALVWVLRALAKLAETFEVLSAKGLATVRDQENGNREGI